MQSSLLSDIAELVHFVYFIGMILGGLRLLIKNKGYKNIPHRT